MIPNIVYGFVLIGLAALVYIVYPSIQKSYNKSQEIKRQKAKEKLEKLQKEVQIPQGVSPPVPPTLPEKTLEQYPIPKSIQVELTRIKEGTGKRATVRKGRVTLVPRFGSGKDVFCFYVGKRGYFIDPGKIITVSEARGKKTVKIEKLVYDVFNGEPLNQDGAISFSWDLETLGRDSIVDQYITVATFEGGFQLTPSLIRILLLIAFLGLMTGLAINGSAGLTPKTIIHWVP